MSSKLAIWFGVMACSTGALAQTITFVQNGTAATSFTFKGDGCSSNPITLQWTYTGTAISQNPMNLWATAGTCGSGPDAGDPSFTAVPYTAWFGTRSGTFDVPLSTLPIFSSADGGVSCGQTGVTLPAYVCAGISYPVGATSQTIQANYKITYDTQPPAVPSSISCSAEDSALSCSYTSNSDTVKVLATARSGGADVASTESTPNSSGSGSFRIKGLTNGVTYSVGIKGYDAAGNVSDELVSDPSTPVQTEGFFGILRDAGSTEEGNGCAIVHSSGESPSDRGGLIGFLVPLAAIALLRALSRRSAR